MNIIDGKKIAEKIKKKLAKEVYALIQKNNRHPNLAIILIGEREDSKLYVSLKEKVAKEVGIDTSLYLIEKDTDENRIIDVIKFLNQDKNIDGILIQLPLPKNFNTDKILQTIDPKKDVDGFNRDNQKIFLSPVLMAIKYSLNESNIALENKKVFLFFNSEIFKNEIEIFFKKMGSNFNSISSKNLNIIIKNKNEFKKFQENIKTNDILLSALGRPEFINKNFLKDDMCLIDIGITKIDKKIFGDIKFADTKKLDGFITPVPGGIGPITVICLLKNVSTSFSLFSKNN